MFILVTLDMALLCVYTYTEWVNHIRKPIDPFNHSTIIDPATLAGLTPLVDGSTGRMGQNNCRPGGV